MENSGIPGRGWSDGKCAILIITHKPYPLPALPGYLPLQVGPGAEIDPSWARDNTGDQISGRNATYCELTGLYWAWKNLDSEILGLAHYRRYPGDPSFLSRFRKKEDRILSGERAKELLRKADLILPRKRHYWIETRESQYAHAHHAEDLRATEEVLREREPDFLPAWKHMLSTRSGHICNMFIMPRELADAYCTWLFPILFEVEKRLDISSYSQKDRRVFGYLGERLLDVWVETKGLKYTEVPVISIEKQHWIRKGAAFLRRKFQRGEG